MRTGPCFVLGVIAALLATASIADADTGAVVVYGKAKPHERWVVTSAVTQIVRDASWVVAEAAFSPAEISSIVGCLELDRPWPCVAPTAAAKRVERVVVVQVELENAGKAVVVTGQVLLASAAVPSIERRFCEPCSDASLDQSATDLMKVLLERTSARQGRTSIAIQTSPPGASIAIDGTMVGSSDATIAVSAGTHQVQLQRSGYRPETRQVMVAEGELFAMAVTLTRSETGGTPGGGDRRPSRLVAGTIAGAGAIALAGGMAYSLTIDPPTTFDQPRRLYSGPAIAVATAGAIGIGVGLYLWFRHPKPRSLATASFANGGGVIGWSTSF